MRRMRVLGWGVAGVMATAAAGTAQFASDRTAAPPPGPQSITAAPQTPPPAAIAPAAQTPVGQPPEAHPWYVKPDAGAWVIMVKAYSGDGAKSAAERLAAEIRNTYRVPAYLFEKGADERRKEEERVARERERLKAAQQREFLAVSDRLRAEALAKGMDFQETAPRYMVPKVRYEEQYAVLIGGWPTMDAARKELDAIRRWQPPKDATLMDQAYVVRPGSGAGEKTFVNPFQAAFVTRNPVAPKVLDAEGRADPLVLRMNEAEELSVLKIQKPWTIVVKSFFVPIQEIRDKDASRSIFSKLFNAKQDTLSATAQQARALAQVLRQTQPRPLEAYVLHTLNGSLVCVGQFDAPDDPALLETQRHLETLTFDERREKAGPVVGHRRMFDQLVAMRVK